MAERYQRPRGPPVARAGSALRRRPSAVAALVAEGHGRREALVGVGQRRADDPVELVVVDPRHRHPADQVDGVLGTQGERHAR